MQNLNSPFTSSLEDRHVICKALMDRAASYRAHEAARSLKHGLSSWRPWLQLPLRLHHKQKYECRLCLRYQDIRIRVWWHRGERTLSGCILNRPPSPSPGLMVWGAIQYTSRLSFVSIDGILSSSRYVSGVLRPVALPFPRAL
ncbi:uncharacterized protein TNCV_2473001 [Trichonephila clavipes]|nr:uncharacterized protein TNCV_2473001 [Trichonephila clavipes]